MKDFFAILFFSKTILLTPQPVTIEEVHIASLTEPVNAITQGASLQIDITSMLNSDLISNMDILGVRREIKNKFIKGSIYADLETQDNKKIRLNYEGGSSIGKSEVRLILSGTVDTELEYSKIYIYSEKTSLSNVKIYWKNYKH